jgi:hypothetical protein
MNIVDIVRSYGIELRKVGRVYQGLCPFHEETNPSFTVYPNTNTFHCFGCGITGDWRRFLELIDPHYRDQFSLDLSVLQDFISQIEKRNYKEYLLVSSAPIFREMFKKYPVSYVFKVMEKFDAFISSKEIVSFEEMMRTLKKLKMIGGGLVQ